MLPTLDSSFLTQRQLETTIGEEGLRQGEDDKGSPLPSTPSRPHTRTLKSKVHKTSSTYSFPEHPGFVHRKFFVVSL